MSLLKSSVNYVPTGKGKGKGKGKDTVAARSRRAYVRRVRADNIQQLQKRVQREENKANRLQQQQEKDRRLVLIGQAALMRQDGKIQHKLIVALMKNQKRLQRNIAGPLRKDMDEAFQKMKQAEYALDRARKDYKQSVKMMKDTTSEVDALSDRLDVEQAKLGELKIKYDKMPTAAKPNKEVFDANLATRVLDLNLSDPVAPLAPVAPGGVVQTGWMADKVEKIARRVAGDKNVDEAKKALIDAMKKAKDGKNKVRV